MNTSNPSYGAPMLGAILSAAVVGAQPAVANGLNGHPGGDSKIVTVDCRYGSIGGALRIPSLRPLVIVVRGTCAEDVLISRDHVTLVAANRRVDGVVGQSEAGAAIAVAGASNVVIDGLRVRSAAGDASSGILVTGNAQATISDALIDDSGYGVWASNGGLFTLRASEVVNARAYGLLLTDGAIAQVENSRIEIHVSDLSDDAAIGAFRSANIRLRGDNQVINSGDNGIPGDDDDGFVLNLYHQVELRQDGGHTRFVGATEIGNVSHASLRDPEIVGSFGVFNGSRADIRRSSNGSTSLAATGGINISRHSALDLAASATVEASTIEIGDKSSLHVLNDVNLTVDGDINVHESSLLLNENVNVVCNGGFGTGNATTYVGSGSRLSIADDLSAFGYGRVGVYGPGAVLEVGGKTYVSAFSRLEIGDDARLVAADALDVSDFSLLYAGNFARIEVPDLYFGSSASKVNFYGEGVTFVGYMTFSPKSDLHFGASNVVIGTVDCGGGSFSSDDGYLGPDATIINCF